MADHIHLGVWFVANVALAMYIVNVIVRIIAAHLSHTPIGRALAFGF